MSKLRRCDGGRTDAKFASSWKDRLIFPKRSSNKAADRLLVSRIVAIVTEVVRHTELGSERASRWVCHRQHAIKCLTCLRAQPIIFATKML